MTLRARANPEEMRERLATVDALLAAGTTHRALERELIEAWSCSRSTARRYIRAAMWRLRIEWARARPHDERIRVVDELRAIAVEARNAGKFGDAVRALDTQARIIGLTQPTFKHHTHEIVSPQPAVIAEVRKPTAELAVEARALVAANAPIADDEDP